MAKRKAGEQDKLLSLLEDLRWLQNDLGHTRHGVVRLESLAAWEQRIRQMVALTESVIADGETDAH